MPSSNCKGAGANASWVARHKNGAWYTLVVICVVAVVSGGVAATAHFALRDAFTASDAALEEAKGGAQRALIFPDAGSFSQVTAPDIEGLNSVWQADSGEYVFDVQSDGFSGATFTSTAVVNDLNIAFEAYAQLGGN